MTLKRDQLTQVFILPIRRPSLATLQKLEFLLSADPQKLLERISELETTVESLRRDNAALRQLQIATAAQPLSPAPPPRGRELIPLANSLNSSGSAAADSSYTISSTGKRHNSTCRYYGKGRQCGPTDGIACKVCGG